MSYTMVTSGVPLPIGPNELTSSWPLDSCSSFQDVSNSDPVVVESWSLSDFSNLPVEEAEITQSTSKAPKSPRKKKKKITPKYYYSSDSDPEETSKNINRVSYICDRCPFMANKPSVLKRHSQIHDLTISRGHIQCPETGCVWRVAKMEYLDQHLQLAHGINIEMETLNFNDDEMMKQWLNQLHETTYARYRRKHARTSKLRVYYCHRSKKFRKGGSVGTGIRTKRKRNYFLAGDNVCTSRIEVRENITNGLDVKYYKTHHGHTLEQWKVSAPWQVRRNIQRKLAKEKALEEKESGQSRSTNEIQQNVTPLNSAELSAGIRRSSRCKRRTQQTIDGSLTRQPQEPEMHQSWTHPESVEFSIQIQDEEQDELSYHSLAVDYFNKLLTLATESKSTNVLVQLLKADLATLEQQKHRRKQTT